MKKLFLLSVTVQMAVASFTPYLQIIFRNKGYSHTLTGVLVALCQLSAIVMPMIISSTSDRKGRTSPFIALVALLSIILAVIFLLSDSLVVTVLSSFLLNGFFWCMNPLADGMLNRSLKGDSSSYGIIRAMGTMSYVIVLVAFALIGFPDEKSNSSILIAIVAGTSLPLITSMIQGEKRREVKESAKTSFSFSWFPRRFYVFMAIVAATRVGQSVVEKLLSSYMTENLGLGSYFLLFVALGALCEFFCMIGFGRLKRKGILTSWALLLISAIGLTVRLLLYLIPGIPAFTLAQTLHGLTFGVLHVAATGYAADNVSSEHYDLAMTIYWSVATNLPEMLGALAGGYVIEYFGYPMLFLSYSAFPFAAVILCFVFRKLLEEK